MLRRLRSCNRVLYVDPKGGEYQFGVECRTVEAVRDLTEKGKTNFCIRIPTKDERAVHWLCLQALKVSADGEVIVAMDELQRFSDSYNTVDGITTVLEDGGWRGVSFIGTTHRPRDIHGDLLAAADRLIIFQTTHRRDIDRLQHYADIPDDVFMQLEQDDYIEWSVDKVGFEIVKGGNRDSDTNRKGEDGEGSRTGNREGMEEPVSGADPGHGEDHD